MKHWRPSRGGRAAGRWLVCGEAARPEVLARQPLCAAARARIATKCGLAQRLEPHGSAWNSTQLAWASTARLDVAKARPFGPRRALAPLRAAADPYPVPAAAAAPLHVQSVALGCSLAYYRRLSAACLHALTEVMARCAPWLTYGMPFCWSWRLPRCRAQLVRGHGGADGDGRAAAA